MAENTLPFNLALNDVRPFASQSEAEAGVNTTKAMNPLRVKQAIEKYLESYSSGWIFRGVWDGDVLDYKEGDMIRWLEILFLAKTDVPKNTPPMFPIDENDPYWEYLIGANIKVSVKAGILDIDGVAPIKYVEDEVFLSCRLLQDSELTLDLSELPINGVYKYLIIDGSGYDLTFGTSYTVIKGNWDNRSGYYNIVELWYEELTGVRVIIHNDLFSIGISEEEPSNNPTLWIDTGEEEPEAPAGMSAYEVWLSEGNSGTEQDFLDSLKGEQGVQGEQGEQGPAGETFYNDIILATADSWTTKKSNGAIPFEEEDANTGHTRWTKLFSPATDQYICLEIRNLNNTLITTNKFNLIMTVKCNEVDLDNKTVGFVCRAYYKKSNQPSGNWWTGIVSTKILTNALQDYRMSFNLVEFIDPVSYDDGCLVIEIKRKTDIQSNVPYDVFMVDTEIHLNK